MNSERNAKLRKLNSFRRALPHVSATALASILDEVSREGVPALHKRSNFREATRLVVTNSTPYGPLLAEIPVMNKTLLMGTIQCINPLAYLYTTFSQGGAMSQLLQETMAGNQSSPERPWRLIFYADEVVPGNAVSYDNKRKIWVIYSALWNLAQSGCSKRNLGYLHWP